MSLRHATPDYAIRISAPDSVDCLRYCTLHLRSSRSNYLALAGFAACLASWGNNARSTLGWLDREGGDAAIQ